MHNLPNVWPRVTAWTRRMCTRRRNFAKRKFARSSIVDRILLRGENLRSRTRHSNKNVTSRGRWERCTFDKTKFQTVRNLWTRPPVIIIQFTPYILRTHAVTRVPNYIDRQARARASCVRDRYSTVRIFYPSANVVPFFEHSRAFSFSFRNHRPPVLNRCSAKLRNPNFFFYYYHDSGGIL